MTRTPPRLPRPGAAQRTFRSPPVPGITEPASGSWLMKSSRCCSVNRDSTRLRKTLVSTTASMRIHYVNDVARSSAGSTSIEAHRVADGERRRDHHRTPWRSAARTRSGQAAQPTVDGFICLFCGPTSA